MSARLSVVIPVHNEAGNIGPLLGRISEVLNDLRREFDVVVVNDGSTDATSDEIARAADVMPGCVEVRLSQRSGQAVALLAGLRVARGDLIITLDGDGQNDPEDIPALLALVESGKVDLACGWRVDRHDSVGRMWMSRVANGVRRAVLCDGVHDAGCQLRVFRAEVRSVLRNMELMQSFVPALAIAGGFRVGEVPVRHHPRRHGDSKYGFLRLLLRPALAMVRLKVDLLRQRAGARRASA